MNNTDAGITISSTSSSGDLYEAITGNTITNNKGPGVLLVNANKNTLFSNVYGYNQKGHSLDNSNNNFIYGSISYSNSEDNYVSGTGNTIDSSQNKFL